ncbi:MAG TPA: hypothetical protein PKA05_06925 [Roseiflexaceae bacterium]|nr:hypothetical protein [Roseiflexaceae bacterium]
MNDLPEMTDAQIGAVLAALRAEVQARRAGAVVDADPAARDLAMALDEIELHRVISAHWPLPERSLPEKLIALFNKLVRRMLRWYINPIVEQQNAYNNAVANALRLLAEAYRDLAAHHTPGEGGSRNHEPPAAGIPADTAADAATLQQLVQQHAAAEPPVRFIELELAALLPQLRQHEIVHAHWPLSGATPLQHAAAFGQRVIRQYLRWLINPIVEQQNSANAATTRAVEGLTRIDANHRALAARRRARRTQIPPAP